MRPLGEDGTEQPELQIQPRQEKIVEVSRSTPIQLTDKASSFQAHPDADTLDVTFHNSTSPFALSPTASEREPQARDP